MKTVEVYESTETIVLQSLLKNYENFLDNVETLIEKFKLANENSYNLEKMRKDYEIDTHLIRMELTKRLWGE